MEREIVNFPTNGNSNGDAAATNLTCKQMHDYKYGGLNKGGIVNLTLDRASAWTRKARENSKKIARESKTVQDCLKKTLDPLEKKHDFLVTKSDSTTEVDI